MRDVAAKARVPLGLINYHFESKEKLFEAIIARRSDELNARRRAAFARSEGQAGHPAGDRRVPAPLSRIDAGRRAGLAFLWPAAGADRPAAALDAADHAALSRRRRTSFSARWRRPNRGSPKEAAARGYAHMVSVMFGMFAANDLLGVISQARLFQPRSGTCLRLMPCHFWPAPSRASRHPARGSTIRRQAAARMR